MRRGNNDGKVYISVKTDNGEYVVFGDRIHVNIDPTLPDPLNQGNQVSVMQEGRYE